MEKTWEFNTIAGAGSEVVKVVYEYEQDEDGTYNESVIEVWFQGKDVIGLLSEEAFRDLECEAAMRFQDHKMNYKMEDV